MNHELALKDIKLINMLPKSLTHKQMQFTFFITKHIQTPIKIPQMHHQHAIELKTHNQILTKTQNQESCLHCKPL
jgi:hypothetical protein